MTAVSSGRTCRHFRVTGRVQGVFYRASTQERALALGLTGWVRNCQNGDVELVACGGAPALEALERWLWQGPPAAQVSAVVRRETDDPSYAGFDVRR